MKKAYLISILAVFFSLIPSQSISQITVIHAGQVLIVPGKAPKTNQTIVIENGKIKMLRDGFQQPAQLGMNNAEMTILDLKDKFLIPGFIDTHTHITESVIQIKIRTNGPHWKKQIFP
jgi:cytosine/adenosine deaminase-related metal-dependent hydrolase